MILTWNTVRPNRFTKVWKSKYDVWGWTWNEINLHPETCSPPYLNIKPLHDKCVLLKVYCTMLQHSVIEVLSGFFPRTWITAYINRQFCMHGSDRISWKNLWENTCLAREIAFQWCDMLSVSRGARLRLIARGRSHTVKCLSQGKG